MRKRRRPQNVDSQPHTHLVSGPIQTEDTLTPILSTISASQLQRAIEAPSQHTLTPKILTELQHTHGNAFVQRLVQRSSAENVVQRSLRFLKKEKKIETVYRGDVQGEYLIVQGSEQTYYVAKKAGGELLFFPDDGALVDYFEEGDDAAAESEAQIGEQENETADYFDGLRALFTPAQRPNSLVNLNDWDTKDDKGKRGMFLEAVKEGDEALVEEIWKRINQLENKGEFIGKLKTGRDLNEHRSAIFWVPLVTSGFAHTGLLPDDEAMLRIHKRLEEVLGIKRGYKHFSKNGKPLNKRQYLEATLAWFEVEAQKFPGVNRTRKEVVIARIKKYLETWAEWNMPERQEDDAQKGGLHSNN